MEANIRADAAAARVGEESIIRGTRGCIFDESGKFVMYQTVQDAYKNLTPDEIAPYVMAPKKYMEYSIRQCFGKSRPSGFIRAFPSPGSTGALHHAICGYTNPGDTVLIADWHWGSYENLCFHNGRNIRTFHLLDEKQRFHLKSFADAVSAVAEKQENLLIILNSPANNPTGYSLSDSEWDGVIACLKQMADKGKNVILVCDVAYMDYSGEKEECRTFFQKFSGLPENFLVLVAYTMSKGFTLYGQRAGTLICITPSEKIADEFWEACQCMTKCTWGSCNGASMNAMIRICEDGETEKALDAERSEKYQMICERAKLFTQEAKETGLVMFPYLGGFFITLPMENAEQVCEELDKQNIFLVPLPHGIRIAICSIPQKKITGLAWCVQRVVRKTKKALSYSEAEKIKEASM